MSAGDGLVLGLIGGEVVETPLAAGQAGAVSTGARAV